MSPGARQRVTQQQERYATTWQHAVQLGEALDLGRPLAIYHTEVTPPLSRRRVLRLLAPIPVFLLIVVLLLAWAPDAAVPLLGVSPLLGGAYVSVFFLISRRGRFTRWLYGYPDGMTEIDPGGLPWVIRWDDVTGAVDEWSSAGSESPTLWSYEGFRLTTTDGETVPVTTRYSNALDPYGPVGGMVSALVPSPAGDAVPHFPSIADLITGQAVTRVVARQAAAVHAGTTVVCGGLRVTRDGIAGPKDAEVTPWSAIERIELRPGRAKLFPLGGKAREYADYRDGSGYATLGRLLLALGVNVTYEPRG